MDTRRYRVLPQREDADEGGMSFVPLEETWPEWQCEECHQRWPGIEIACGFCGRLREDIDQCA